MSGDRDSATTRRVRLRIAYADPPYPGCAHLYRGHPDYAGEVDHKELVDRLEAEYDGWCLHTSSTALAHVLSCIELAHVGVRVMAWVKPFAAFKRNVSVAYAWEPVIVKAARKPVVKLGMTYRDWLAEPITLRRGLTGAKPDAVCRWLFEVMGCEPDDELHDLYPGTGAVSRAWDAWQNQLRLEEVV
jgi:hypothetical protein